MKRSPLDHLHKIQSHLEAHDEHALDCDCHFCQAQDEVAIAIIEIVEAQRAAERAA